MPRSRSYVSAMSCMSAYSMPLCTIFTKCPAPSGPMRVQHGSSSTWAEMISRNGPSSRVGVGVAARHDRRAVERTDLAAGDPDPGEADPLLRQRLVPAHGVAPVRVAGVGDDVALVEQRHELVDDGVGALAGLDHDDDPARALERVDEVLERAGDGEVALVAVLLDERLGLARRAVVDGDPDAVAGEVAGEVAAHHREARHPHLGGTLGGRCGGRGVRHVGLLSSGVAALVGPTSAGCTSIPPSRVSPPGPRTPARAP